MNDPLDRLARRVGSDPFFLAPVLAAYADAERLDDAGLCAVLACTPAALTRLRLCRPPREAAGEFWADVTQIAGAFGLDPDRLADAVRRGNAVAAFRQARGRTEGHLSAAREDDPPAPPPPEGAP